jgi:cell wall-associated NlpC family hydrolase
MLKNQLPSLLILALILTLLGCSSSRKTVSKSSGDKNAALGNVSSQRRAVVIESMKWMGTPYRYGGNSRNGIDCSGFVSRMYSRIGFELPRTAREMYSCGAAVSLRAVRPGDLVFFSNTAGRGITHVGIYVGNYEFIHASTARGVITSTLEDEYYHRHYAGARKILR